MNDVHRRVPILQLFSPLPFRAASQEMAHPQRKKTCFRRGRFRFLGPSKRGLQRTREFEASPGDRPTGPARATGSVFFQAQWHIEGLAPSCFGMVHLCDRRTHSGDICLDILIDIYHMLCYSTSLLCINPGIRHIYLYTVWFCVVAFLPFRYQG